MTPQRLLSIGADAKTVKGRKTGYETAIMYLAPHTLSGTNLCPMATKGCAAACLFTSGHGALPSVREARLRRTRFYLSDRAGFMDQVAVEVERFVAKTERQGMIPAVRLNGTSDVRWERIAVGGAASIMDLFPTVQFYDYTKLPNRRDLPANYHLTYSLAEGQRSWDGHLRALDNGYSVAVVLRGAGISRFPKPFPATWNGRPLVDGDLNDLRFQDPAGVYVGLRAKGLAVRDETGFVYDLERIAA